MLGHLEIKSENPTNLIVNSGLDSPKNVLENYVFVKDTLF
jgi:hypothetical protein